MLLLLDPLSSLLQTDQLILNDKPFLVLNDKPRSSSSSSDDDDGGEGGANVFEERVVLLATMPRKDK